MSARLVLAPRHLMLARSTRHLMLVRSTRHWVLARSTRHLMLVRSTRHWVLARTTLAVLLALVARRAGAQDFAPVVPPAVVTGVVALLDLGLPPPSVAAELGSGVARPFGLAELDAGWVAAGGGWRALRTAAGVARGGDRSLGWHALAAGIGCAHTDAGVALRVVVRRDRARDWAGADDPATLPANLVKSEGDPALLATGGEIGVGGWLELTSSAYAWVAHPQIATRGAAPPLRRALEAGIAWRNGPACMWLVREAAPRTRASETHRAGLALGVPGAWVWSEMRDGPLRAAVGVAGRAGPSTIAAVADMHPVLPLTARLSLSVGGAAW